MTTPLRVGIVNYLNSRPLAWSFLQGEVGSAVQVSFLPPAQVADRLAGGDLDVGLIPSIELQRIPHARVLPGLCVAATREVRSVLLLSRCPVDQITRLALDENSRTSAVLVRILLRDLHGIEPECVSAAPVLAEMMENADAALIIGDPALAVDRSGLQVLDLAAAWHQMTGRPFVFAVWAVRAEVDLGARAGIFYRSLAAGRANLESLIGRAAEELGLDNDVIRCYLSDCLSFELGEEELAGLSEYYLRAHSLGHIDRLRPLEMVPSCDPANDSVE